MKAVRLLLASVVTAMLLASATHSAVSQTKKPTPVVREQSTKQEKQLVILDTDIGDDIDDAFALALLLQSPEARILGITSAYGDTDLRARLLDRYLAAVGRSDIPVGIGVSTKPANVFSQSDYASQSPRHNHVSAEKLWADLIHAHPGQITLLAIGPLTNVRTFLAHDPTTFRKLQRVVIMGGSIYRGYGSNPPEPEWNIRCDPDGLRALLNSGVPVFMMPLDSTQIPLEATQREQIFTHDTLLSQQLLELYREWKKNNPDHSATPTLFDPVAVSYALRPQLCQTKSLRIEVDSNGLTRAVEGPSNADVCVQSDEKAFLEFLLQRLL